MSVIRREGFVQFGNFSDKGEVVLQMRTSTLFGAKKLRIFRNIRCVHMDKGEVEVVRTFCGQGGRGSIFRDSVRMSVMDGPLLLMQNKVKGLLNHCSSHVLKSLCHPWASAAGAGGPCPPWIFKHGTNIVDRG